MKHSALRKLAAAALAVVCLAAAGCVNEDVDEKELYYDPTFELGTMSSSGYQDVYDIECCVIFRANFLRDYVGWEITDIRLCNPADVEINYTPFVYESRAWAAAPGDSAGCNAEPKPIAPKTWQLIPLDMPVTIAAGTDYWAGYKVTTIPGQMVIAQGSRFNRGNSRIAFYGSGEFQKARSNYLVRVTVKRKPIGFSEEQN